MPANYKLILLRHGQSLWNQKNIFTGWEDIDLSSLGVKQATEAGIILKKNNINLDFAFCSVLKRSVKTLWHVLDVMDLCHLQVQKSWQLNERHYGSLQGVNKADARKKYGKEQVHLWRRSFLTKPPLATQNKSLNLSQYAEIKNPILGESLKETQDRVLLFWQKHIVKKIKENKTLIIVAHGNSLRALIQSLDTLNEEQLLNLNIPTGEPILYHLDANLKTIKSEYLK